MSTTCPQCFDSVERQYAHVPAVESRDATQRHYQYLGAHALHLYQKAHSGRLPADMHASSEVARWLWAQGPDTVREFVESALVHLVDHGLHRTRINGRRFTEQVTDPALVAAIDRLD